MLGIQKLTLEEFPALLREIPDPPRSLYVRGELPDASYKYLAVVGSRRMSSYGKDACEYLIKGLAGYPIVIVSGLALGIDGVAHRSALENGLKTLAVPGSGLDESVLYPRAHLSLSRDILDSGGALVSEMEPREPATTYSFPKRNRLMAGIAHATLIIEATQKSGTLITAKLAVDYGRDLLVVPHSIFSEGGEGGHIFSKLGALEARSPADILETLGIESRMTESTIQLTVDERALLDLLVGPLSRDELVRELKKPVSEANVLLASMELRGLVAETLGEIRRLV